MKIKTLLLPVCILMSGLGFSQSTNYQLFRFDFGFVYAIPAAQDWANGFGGTGALKANITNNIDAGLREDVIVFLGAKGYSAGDNVSVGISAAAAKSTSIVGEYFFKDDGSTRPFGGLGVGYYVGGGASTSTTTSSTGATVTESGRAFAGVGISPSLGIDLNWFRLEITYNLVFATSKVQFTQTASSSGGVSQVVSTQNFSNNFLEFLATFRIGGKNVHQQ